MKEKRLLNQINSADVLVFDLEDTLISTSYANFLAYADAILQIMNIDISTRFKTNVRFTRDSLKTELPQFTSQEIDAIIKLKERLFEKYLGKTHLNHEIVAVLKKYASLKTTVLATNSREGKAILLLQYHRLTDYFNRKFYRQEQIHNKYERALTSLQVSPHSVVVFENDDTEIEAAIIAGIPKENIILNNQLNK